MIYGHVRDDAPRVSVRLPALDGELAVEFLLDTGFDDWMCLPAAVIRLLEARPDGYRLTRHAGGDVRPVPAYLVELDWMGELVEIDVLEIDNQPLLGTRALRGNLIQIEMIDGGEVSVEPLG